jgi:hypothetical protein
MKNLTTYITIILLFFLALSADAQRNQLKWSTAMKKGTANKFAGWNASGVPVEKDAVSTPGGSDTQVQFNNAGSFAGSSDFTFSPSTGLSLNTLGLHGTGYTFEGTQLGNLHVQQQNNSATPTDQFIVEHWSSSASTNNGTDITYYFTGPSFTQKAIGKLRYVITDATAASEDTKFQIINLVAGTETVVNEFSTGGFALGSTSLSGSQRTISTASSGTSADLLLSLQGAGELINANADAGTNNIIAKYVEQRNSSGTVANGFGVQNLYVLETSTGGTSTAADVIYKWTDATTASLDSYIGVNGIAGGVSSSPVYSWDSGNLALLSAAGSFGSGALVIFIPNATTVPTTNPTGGGIMYVEGGALKYRSSAGTVTTIAPN